MLVRLLFAPFEQSLQSRPETALFQRVRDRHVRDHFAVETPANPRVPLEIYAMFGIYRYGLAFCVAISHLWAGMLGGPAAYAVWGFYCLSGYLMTLILNEKYGFSGRGIGRFAVNRALRIYPAYYVVCIGMFLLFYFKPGTAARLLPHLAMPSSAQGWRYSLFLMTEPGGGELVHGSSRSPRRTLVLCSNGARAGEESLDHGGLVHGQCGLHDLARRHWNTVRGTLYLHSGMLTSVQLRQPDLSHPRLVAGDQNCPGRRYRRRPFGGCTSGSRKIYPADHGYTACIARWSSRGSRS